MTILILLWAVFAFTWDPLLRCVTGSGEGCLEGPMIGSREGGLLFAALLFSLAGDVFLMLPRDLFVAGLVSFLGAHVCYIVAFQPSAAAREPLVIGTLVALLVVGAVFYSRIRRAMVARGMARLVPPVLLYIIVISQM
ncbi:MAG: hypothetical protein GEU78_16820, partial [Actinobacteria bacterium]|nr:hypothetical protein [Actinomycetota bacterium]